MGSTQSTPAAPAENRPFRFSMTKLLYFSAARTPRSAHSASTRMPRLRRSCPRFQALRASLSMALPSGPDRYSRWIRSERFMARPAPQETRTVTAMKHMPCQPAQR